MKTEIVLSLLVLIFSMPTSQVLSRGNLDSAEELFDAEKYERAIRHLKEVIREDPLDARAHVLLGDCYGRLGKHKDAIKAYHEAIRINPSNTEALFGLGMTYGKLDRRPEAIEAFRKVVEINPSDAEAHFYLGVTYDRQNQISNAWEQYKILKGLDEKLADRLYHIIFW